MVSIRRVLAQIKDGWTAVLSEEHLTRVCRESGFAWRQRTLNPVVTIYVFRWQVLHANTAMTHLPRLSGKRFTPAGAPGREKGQPRSTWLARCGYHDQLVLWRRPRTVSRTMTAAQHAALPQYVVVRELRYRVRTPGFRTWQVTLVTTLLDPQRYPPDAVADLYRQRWQVETNLRHLKQTLGVAVLHSQTVAGVQKGILVFALVYNLVQSVRARAAAAQGVAREQLSFVDALRHLRWPLATPAPPALWVNPLRPDRYEPRVRKRRPPEYSLMTQPRAALRQAIRRPKHAA